MEGLHAGSRLRLDPVVMSVDLSILQLAAVEWTGLP